MEKHISIKTTPNGDDARVILDDIDIARNLYGLEIVSRAGDLPEVTLKVCVRSFDFSGQSKIMINGKDIPESIAKELYEELKKRFDV